MARSFAYKLGRVVKRAALADVDLAGAPPELMQILQSIAGGQRARDYAASQASWLRPFKRIRSGLSHNEVRSRLVDIMAAEMGKEPWGSAPGASNPEVYSAIQQLLNKKLQSAPSKSKAPADKKKKD